MTLLSMVMVKHLSYGEKYMDKMVGEVGVVVRIDYDLPDYPFVLDCDGNLAYFHSSSLVLL